MSVKFKRFQPTFSGQNYHNYHIRYLRIQDTKYIWSVVDAPLPMAESRATELWLQRSRQWIIWHVLEHDIHHGGELSSILGAYGLSAVDI